MSITGGVGREGFERALDAARDNIHKARPSENDPYHCATCQSGIKRVPGGQGPTYIHEATGAVAASGTDPDRLQVTVRLTSEITRETKWEIDLLEFLEWSCGEDPTPKKVKEFIEADREFDQVLDSMWAQGRDVKNTAFPFPDIEEVRL